MTITAVISQDAFTQKDGRTYVREIYSDAQGECVRVEYLAPVGADTSAIASARTPSVLNALQKEEAFAAVFVEAAPILRFQTGAEFLQRLREFYRTSQRDICTRIARWIIHRLDAGDVTAAQLRTVFGLTAQQWSTLEAKMRGFASDQDGVDAAVGE